MPNENENQNLVDETVEKIVTMNNLQDAFDRYDLLNKPEYNPDDINNNIFRKGIGQWSLEIKTGFSAEDSLSNTTTWTIRLTQDMIDVINELADGSQSYVGGPLKYCSVRCLRDPYHLNIESVIRITRESTSIPDLQVG